MSRFSPPAHFVTLPHSPLRLQFHHSDISRAIMCNVLFMLDITSLTAAYSFNPAAEKARNTVFSAKILAISTFYGCFFGQAIYLTNSTSRNCHVTSFGTAKHTLFYCLT
jgi:hypothetical protein